MEVPARCADRTGLLRGPAIERCALVPETTCLSASGKVTSKLASQKRFDLGVGAGLLAARNRSTEPEHHESWSL